MILADFFATRFRIRLTKMKRIRIRNTGRDDKYFKETIIVLFKNGIFGRVVADTDLVRNLANVFSGYPAG